MRLSTGSILITFGALIGVSTTTIAQRAPAPPRKPSTTATTPPAIDPTAIAALGTMGTFLRTQRVFSIRAEARTDEVLTSGQKVQLESTSTIQIRRPDRLRADLVSDRNVRQFFYDGKTFTINGPKVRYYANVPAPATIGDLAEEMSRRYDVEIPLVDLYYWGTDKSKTDAITDAIDVGPAMIDGVQTEHYAFRQPGLDWQIWIEKGPKPLPRRLVLTSTDEPSQPQHAVDLRWDLSPTLDEAIFSFTPPEDFYPIPLTEAVPAKVTAKVGAK